MKKGYTLVELLGVIAILVILILIMFTAYTQFKNDTEASIDSAVEIMISEVSEKYVKKYKTNIKNGNVYCITLKDLLDNNMMSDPVTNSDGEKISESTQIRITIVNDRYEVDVDVSKCRETITSN